MAQRGAPARTGPGLTERGAGWKEPSHQPGLRAATWTVTELEPGHSFTWSSVTPGLRTVAVPQVQSSPGGSTLTLTVRQSGALAPLVAVLMGAKVRRFMAMEARGLAKAATRTPGRPDAGASS